MQGWNTKINARDTNYGTRVDYILVTPGLLPWIQHGDIQPSIKGSDHCPIYIDLRESITLESGEELLLKQVMNNTDGKISRISAKHWDEYSGKQKLLSSFFSKKLLTSATTPEIIEEDVVCISSQDTVVENTPPTPITIAPQPKEAAVSKRKHENSTSAPSGSTKAKKAKTTPPTTTSRPQGQTKLSSFFNSPKLAKNDKTPPQPVAESSKARERSNSDVDEETLAAIARIPEVPDETQKQQWSELLAPVEPPKCPVHGEPAKELTTKQGKNKGKKFWICSR
jgi:AP endonuclease-2